MPKNAEVPISEEQAAINARIVRQAVGSQLAWPRDLIILSDVTVCYLHNNVNIFYFYVLDGY